MNAMFLAVIKLPIWIAVIWLLYWVIVEIFQPKGESRDHLKAVFMGATSIAVLIGIVTAFTTGGPRMEVQRAAMPQPSVPTQMREVKPFVEEVDRRGKFDRPSSLPQKGSSQ